MATTVININQLALPRSGQAPKYFYCGRGSDFGNPWSHLPYSQARYIVKTREEAINNHREWLKTQPALIARIRNELRGRVLGCFCKPEPCHCDTLAFVADGGEL